MSASVSEADPRSRFSRDTAAGHLGHVDHPAIARACGGYGETGERAHDLDAAFDRAATSDVVPVQPSDFYPRAPCVLTKRCKVFHLSTTVAFNRPTPGAKEQGMASKSETLAKRTIRRQQLREMVPLADSTIYDMEQRGEFPRRFALSPRCVVWDLGEVEAWLASRRSAPIARAQPPDVTQRRSRPMKAPGRVQAAASKGE
jgi:prophage regulatory protein